MEKAWVFHDNFYGEEWKDGPSWPPHGIFCQISVSKPSKITKWDQFLWTYHLISKFLRFKRRQKTLFTSFEVTIWPENKLRIRKFILFCEKFHTKMGTFRLKITFLNQKSELGKFFTKIWWTWINLFSSFWLNFSLRLLLNDIFIWGPFIFTKEIENNLHIYRF